MNKNDLLKSFAQKAKRRLVGRENVCTAKIKIISNDDEEFRGKVEKLLAQDEVVTNPMKYLIDDKVFRVLDSDAKERYLLSTLDKYLSMKNQFESKMKTAL